MRLTRLKTPVARALFHTLAMVCLFAAIPASADRNDRNQPLELEADSASYDDVKQVYKLVGNVILTKGTILLKSHTAEVRVDPEGYQHAVSTAKPGELAYMRQKRDGENQFIEGYGERIEFNGKTETARLINRARMIRLDGKVVADDVRGTLITYDSRNEFFTVNSDPTLPASGNTGRVRAILAPRNSGGDTPTKVEP